MRQCELTGVARSTIYTPRLVVQLDEQELALLALIDAEYNTTPATQGLSVLAQRRVD